MTPLVLMDSAILKVSGRRNKQAKPFYRYRFFFIYVGVFFNHCVQFLQQVHECARNEETVPSRSSDPAVEDD